MLGRRCVRAVSRARMASQDTLCDIGPMPWGDETVDIEDLRVFMSHWKKQNGPVLP